MATTVAEIMARDPQTVQADVPVSEAAKRMRVVEGTRPVGVVILGDLAVERDEDSVLADISAAKENN